MAELFDSVKAFQDDGDCMAGLAESCDLDSAGVARKAFGLAVPIAIDGLVSTSSTATGAKGLLRTARGLRWSERVDPASLFTELDESMSQTLTRQVLGASLDERVAELTKAAGISESSAHSVIETAMAVSLASATGVSGQDLSLERLTSMIAGESAGKANNQAAPTAAVGDDEDDVADSAEPELTEPEAAPVAAGSATTVDIGSKTEGPSGDKRMLVGAGLAAVLLVGIGIFILSSGGDDGSGTETATASTEAPPTEDGADTDDEVTSGDDATADAAATDSVTTGDGATDDVGDEADDSADDSVSGLTPIDTDAGDDGIVSLSIPMTDIAGISTESEGTIEFDFNTETGEICYATDATNLTGPYRSHIHVGGADVEGGIVVDLGALENGATGCVDNLPVDTAAILADPAGHYAELHDATEEFTIRGQLSEAMDDSSEGSGDSDTVGAVDTDGGGATTVLRGGIVYLEGEVSSQAIADDLVAQLSGLDSSTEIVNDLTVVAGAPLPSGRVVIADAIFFESDSDAVKAVDQANLDAIVALAKSREDLVLTIVGHTDSQGDDVYNLELSLRRAAAVRDLLVAEGLADGEILTRGAGETAPIGDNETDAGRAENRRIEFEFATS